MHSRHTMLHSVSFRWRNHCSKGKLGILIRHTFNALRKYVCHLRDEQVSRLTFHLYPSFPEKKKVKLIYESLVIEGFEENTPGSRLDFRSSIRGKECGLISRTAAGNRAYPGPLWKISLVNECPGQTLSNYWYSKISELLYLTSETNASVVAERTGSLSMRLFSAVSFEEKAQQNVFPIHSLFSLLLGRN